MKIFETDDVQFDLKVRKIAILSQDLSSRDHGVNPCQDESNAARKNEDTSNEWKSSGRRSVHEMIKRFQQVPGMHNGWRGPRSGSSEPTSPEHSQCSQNQRVQPQGGVGNTWRGEGEVNLIRLLFLEIDRKRSEKIFYINKMERSFHFCSIKITLER